MRTVFFGTSPFAAAVLERLAASEHRPSLVVTRPDRRAGRGRRLAAPAIVEAARAMDLEVFQPESINDDGFFLDEDTFVSVREAMPMPVYPSYDFIDVLSGESGIDQMIDREGTAAA